MSDPLFSIITPCSPKRYASTLPRALASVKAQTVTDWEHILVINTEEATGFWSAVREEDLDPRQKIFEAPPNPGWPDIGAWNFRFGAEKSTGRYVGWLCDDDEYLPHHLQTHLAYLTSSGADFTVSKTAFYLKGRQEFVVGDHSFALSHLDSNGVVCRRELLKDGIWRNTGQWDADWDMVAQWRGAGHRGEFVEIITGIHHDGWLARNMGLPDN